MRKPLKFVHTVATAVLVGALLLQLIVAWRYGDALAAGDAAAAGARLALADAVRWLTAPSLAVVLVSGLLLMGMKVFNSAGWVWAKALIGLLLAKGVLTLVDPAAREIAALVRAGAAAEPARLAELARMEWGGVWVALSLVAAAIAFGVWRPRFGSGSTAAGPDAQARASRAMALDPAGVAAANEAALAPSAAGAADGQAVQGRE